MVHTEHPSACTTPPKTSTRSVRHRCAKGEQGVMLAMLRRIPQVSNSLQKPSRRPSTSLVTSHDTNSLYNYYNYYYLCIDGSVVNSKSRLAIALPLRGVWHYSTSPSPSDLSFLASIHLPLLVSPFLLLPLLLSERASRGCTIVAYPSLRYRTLHHPPTPRSH